MGRNQESGALGEARAAKYLIESGYRILDRNWRVTGGEIDIVAQDGDNRIIFVEVKARRDQSFGHPLEAITHQKAQRLRKLALAWLISHNSWSAPFRIDAVAIIGLGEEFSLDHRKAIA
jgi:putative endonuclease